ncbi:MULTISPECIES: SulP family inorganic anion transporter [unclassified Leifsonia]|uniref:SulP family inorganic anion transporter n=1 Tax=unclassified Leifsonia TaxID=2663824 RepID=UPI001A037C73|nr:MULTISPECIES: SulP family inorganic anion transporter [unclassified Leifsonia]
MFRPRTLGRDAIAGVVLGIESVPDGLANGLLAGVNPVAGLYAYLYGMAGAALFTSSTFMAVQGTGAMALVVADAHLSALPDPGRALFTLAMLTGVLMVVAGVAGGGRLLRFVPTAVMVGFVTAVGVNIVLGQLSAFTGSPQTGANRVLKAFNILSRPQLFHLPTLAVSVLTAALIVLLTRTRLKALGLVLAVVAGSVLASVFDSGSAQVPVVADIASIPSGLPPPVGPSIRDVVPLLIPALSLTFVGLVQGAAVSSGVPNPGRRGSDPSQDFIGQGAGNILSGLFQGMPVGGSMSASALIVTAGAKTRLALFVAAGVMVVTIVALAGVVSRVAMPSLAALLIVVGVGSIKPVQIASVVKTGALQTTTMAITFVLTLLIPVQFAVLVGVGLGTILFVVQQSNRLRLRQLSFASEGRDGRAGRAGRDGRIREHDPVAVVGAEQVIVLQPYGSLFFASAPVFEAQLPRVAATTRRSVVILRLRGVDQLGLSMVDVLLQYARGLAEHDSRLWVASAGERVQLDLAAGGLTAEIGEDAVFPGTEWLGATTRRAHDDAIRWVRRDGLEDGTSSA